MDFKLSDQQKELQDTARSFAQNEMVEVADSMEQTSEPLSKEWLIKYSEMEIYARERAINWIRVAKINFFSLLINNLNFI